MEQAYADLANQLTVLRGYAELMLGGDFGSFDAAQRAALQSVLDSSTSAQQILREARGGEASPGTAA